MAVEVKVAASIAEVTKGVLGGVLIATRYSLDSKVAGLFPRFQKYHLVTCAKLGIWNLRDIISYRSAPSQAVAMVVAMTDGSMGSGSGIGNPSDNTI